MDQGKGSSRAYHLDSSKHHHYSSGAESPPKSLSGSEFALRVALCDLVERLKRSEQTNKYLEQCRNELAKEVIRLRQENSIISKENSLSSAIIHNELLRNSKYSIGNSGDENVTSSSSPGAAAGSKAGRHILSSSGARRRENDATELKQKQAMAELELLKNATETDESWEEITVRLLRQLNEEMKAPPTISLELEAKLESTGSTVAAETCDQSSSTATTATELNSRTVQRPRVYLAAEQAGKANVPSPSSSSTSPPECLGLKSEDYETQTKQMAINEPAVDIPSEQFLSFEVHENKNQLKSVIKVTGDYAPTAVEIVSSSTSGSKICDDANTTDRGTTTTKENREPFTAEMCCKILASFAGDFDVLWRQMNSQNEKLTKLKNKQLRTYFRRQLNDDHIISAKTHLEHV